MHSRNVKPNGNTLSEWKHDTKYNTVLLEVHGSQTYGSLDLLMTVNYHLEHYYYYAKIIVLLINDN